MTNDERRAGVSSLHRSPALVEPLERRTLMAASVPSGLSATTIATGLDGPSAMAIVPDGRIFIAEQNGLVRVVRKGKLLHAPFLHMPVDNSGERGLLGITLDPNFQKSGFLYVYYNPKDSLHPHNVVSRYTADGNVYKVGSEKVLLSTPIFSTDELHDQGGALHFGGDGKLYIGIGDHEDSALSQSLNNVDGKLLRINSDGSIPTDNPFYQKTTGLNRAIWAVGLRNPYTFAFQPGTGTLYINDVGQDNFEEIDKGKAGANYGWPETEGPTTNRHFISPVYSYSHGLGEFQGFAITGGTFYDPATAALPSKYAGDYFFADLESGWIHTVDPAKPGNSVATFASGFDMPLDLAIGPDGAFYVLTHGTSAGTGAVTKIL